MWTRELLSGIDYGGKPNSTIDRPQNAINNYTLENTNPAAIARRDPAIVRRMCGAKHRPEPRKNVVIVSGISEATSLIVAISDFSQTHRK